ncbi:hypothetical protein BKA82DRAFT_2749572 [Pisolithus tinctorius]|nr:hypothetical protein BKA82DRAFT_2749572 [Pisolithus tinctorius]
MKGGESTLRTWHFDLDPTSYATWRRSSFLGTLQCLHLRFENRGLRVVRKEKVNSGVETPVSQSPHHRIRFSRLRSRPHRNNKPTALPNTRRRTSRRITKSKAGPRENTPINFGRTKLSSAPINTQQEQSTYSGVSQEEKYGRFSVTSDASDLMYPPGVHDCDFEVDGHIPTLAPIQQEWNVASLYSTSTNGAFLTDARSPCSTERQTIYGEFSDSLGPVCGIQECVGTYRQHMQDRSRLYYDSVHSADKPSLPADLNRAPALETNDFRFWGSSSDILGSEQNYLTLKHDIQKTMVKQLEDRLNYEYRVPLIGSDQSFVQTLDDLFPTPPIDMSHIIDSPVVRSGQFAVTFPFRTLPEIKRELPSEDWQIHDPFGDIHGFTTLTNQQSANIPLQAVEMERFQSTPKSLTSYADHHSITLSSANSGSSTLERRVRRCKGPFDQTDAHFVTFGQCRSPLRERHSMRTMSATSRSEPRTQATAPAGGSI